MIQANELRIGNWVHFVNSNGAHMNFQINVFHLAYMVEADPEYVQHGYGLKYEGNITGIALTPEILEKCGFSWRNGYLAKDMHVASMLLGFYAGVSDKMTLIQKTAPIDEGLFPNDRLMHFGVNHPIYLHQLQNLYFALTGEELTVNLFSR
jgi:hypothetical protein